MTKYSWITLLIFGFCLFQSSMGDNISEAQKVAELKEAPTQVGRLQLLEDRDFVFSFINPINGSGESNGLGGRTVAASSSNFPALIGNDIASTVGFLGPCGMNTPHTHPRSTEFNYIANGSLVGGLLAEDGARFIVNTIPTGSATIFPAGAIHFEFNNDCEPATFVAFFNDQDPGVLQVAQRFFGLPLDVVDASLGGIGVVEVAMLATAIPDNVNIGLQECRKRCGINTRQDKFLQQQPRNSLNALPSGFVQLHATVSDSSTTTSPLSSSTSKPNSSSGIGKGAILGATSNDASNNAGPFDSANKNRGLIIGLIVAVGVLGLGYFGLALAAFIRRRRPSGAPSSSYVRTGGQYAPDGMYEHGKLNVEPMGRPRHYAFSTPYDRPSGSFLST